MTAKSAGADIRRLHAWSCVFILPAFLMSSCLVSPLSAAGSEKVASFSPEVLATVWEGNQRLISSVRYKMEYEYDATQEGLTLRLLRRSGGHVTEVPPGYEPERGTIAVSSTQLKSRVEMKRFGRETQRMIDHTLIVWDGQTQKQFQPISQTGTISGERPSMDGMRIENLGLSVMGVPLHEYLRENRASLAGNVLTITKGQITTKIYLDPSQQYWPNKIEHYSADIIRLRYSQIKVESLDSPQGPVFFPVSANYEAFLVDDDAESEKPPAPVPYIKGVLRAVDVQLNVPDIETDFDYAFPDGAQVMDLIADTRYVVGRSPEADIELKIDKSMNRLISDLKQEGAAKNAPPEAAAQATDLPVVPVAQDIPRDCAWLFWALAAVVVGVSSALFVILRKRSRSSVRQG